MYSSDILIEKVNQALKGQIYPSAPLGLYEPIAYTLDLGGKRIRPVFLLLAYQLYKDEVEQAMPVALALETYHNYTLLHDDLMDNATLRRGKETVHTKWNNNTAILSGDTMLVLAYQHLLNSPLVSVEALHTFTQTALEVGEGQQYDMNFETSTSVTEAEYIEMIRLKTSVLVACATKLGGMLGGAKEEDLQNLYAFGEQIGLAFQLQDDYLDTFGTTDSFGKNIGGDILCNKKTFLAINAFLRADEEQKKVLQRWFTVENFDKEEKIQAVTSLYLSLGIKALCKECIEMFYAQAKKHLEAVSVSQERKKELWRFAQNLLNREQ